MRTLLLLLLSAISVMAHPAWFEPNKGQAHSSVEFLSQGVYIAAGQVAIHTRGDAKRPVVLTFSGSNASARGEGEDRLPGISQVFTGSNPNSWQHGIPHYRRVRYRDIYQGIGVQYYWNQQGQLEYDLMLDPGAKPEQIRLHFSHEVRIDAAGCLHVGDTVHRPPHVYQERDVVAARYVREGPHDVRLAIGDYDLNRSLTIDPVVEFATYLGGTSYDIATAISTDPSGNIYVAATSRVPSAPGLNPFQQVSGLTQVTVVLKMAPDGKSILFYTVIGGGGDTYPSGLALDSAGNIYVTGTTTSIDLPVKSAVQSAFGGGFQDGFVAKISPDGARLVYVTYLGGKSNDFPNGIAVDKQGSAVIAGTTASSNFPLRNAFLSEVAASAGFISKLSPAGDQFVYSTFLAGTAQSGLHAVALDSSGNAIVTGSTFGNDFPMRGGFQQTLPSKSQSASSAIVCGLSADGQNLLFSTYLSGNNVDSGSGVALDSSGDIYVTGQTRSTDMPLANALQAVNGGGIDTFVAKLDRTGQRLLFSTYWGSEGDDVPGGIRVGDDGMIWLAGTTGSRQFPARAPLQNYGGGVYDAFAVKISPAGPTTVYSTLIGGSGDDRAYALAVSSSGTLFLTGPTTSSDFPVKNAFQPANGGGFADMFLVRLSDDVAAGWTLNVSPAQLSFTAVAGAANPASQSVTVTSTPPGAAVSPVSSASWLKATVASPSAPTTVNVSVDTTGLAPGSYSGALRFDATTTAAVTLQVKAKAPVLRNVAPAFVPVGSGATAITLTGTDFASGAIVLINGTGVATGVTLENETTIRVLLSASSFSGAGTLAFVVRNPLSDPSGALQLTVGEPAPVISAVTNAASYGTTFGVSPGEIVTLFGSALGPTVGQGLELDGNGRIKTKLGSVRVLFDGLEAPLIYVRGDQISAVVPYAIAGRNATMVSVEHAGRLSQGFGVAVSLAVPGIFSANASGKGQGAILNQDQSTNGPENPATRGSVIAVYATGEGVTNPPGIDGAVTGQELARPVQTVAATIDGKPAEVLYAGSAPGLVAGVLQVNIRVPDTVSLGSVPIILTVGTISTQAGITVAIH